MYGSLVGHSLAACAEHRALHADAPWPKTASATTAAGLVWIGIISGRGEPAALRSVRTRACSSGIIIPGLDERVAAPDGRARARLGGVCAGQWLASFRIHSRSSVTLLS
jgi:hypothetical protein